MLSINCKKFRTNINADPFEGVARSLPYKIILKHLNQPKQIEALLFGQAGFLEGSFRELYPHQLQAEYVFLKSKYRLKGTVRWNGNFAHAACKFLRRFDESARFIFIRARPFIFSNIKLWIVNR
ncbi:MAG: DUF2851 family protein [Bacteroidetes bacterium]|nr:DUF2851 family protein [Bacteroidota bacterium]